MKPETLLAIKRDIRKFSGLYDVLVDVWNGKLAHGNNATYPHTIQIGVILKNLSFISSEMGHEKELEEFLSLLNALREINEYHGRTYMTHYAWSEVYFIYIGHNMLEDC